MKNNDSVGSHITVDSISDSHNIAIGPNASVSIKQTFTTGEQDALVQKLRLALEGIYDDIDQAGLSRDLARSAQTAAGNALNASKEKEVKCDEIATNVKNLAGNLKEGNAVVKEGTSLWNNLHSLVTSLGPLIGGAKIAAAWFGITL